MSEGRIVRIDLDSEGLIASALRNPHRYCARRQTGGVHHGHGVSVLEPMERWQARAVVLALTTAPQPVGSVAHA